MTGVGEKQVGFLRLRPILIGRLDKEQPGLGWVAR